ncbi:MAG: exodeoxyribonuclease VII small subunit [gamma proteobacterium symbiont of Bathyaustriella thionipta]|nr:exodeoxyribonuclease VII small subunit [gamma proteobacterium symbiont of Bathyaustriella thionipta]MCU7948638.1 exodeoxyribonuclease VII small subunit [gamma proteobacterium symbiont of Bathyaustriella thionipta]MCU7953044.1 exodeoxyribonuclease VII small subunit [gamma proteobacterium symbiont of Bathyaustriella thionipta]MCU7955356.1 exodeoxyribonuclease VII small subunit [gamma proteobacterium symbiont of Bathyaustriella thionipta]MCU7967518.1 exodeoxyribonuclease VII small subunit [gamm
MTKKAPLAGKNEPLTDNNEHPVKKKAAIKKQSSVVKESKKFDFEASLNELEKLVDALEEGDLSLEQSLQDFERGINLTRSCQNALTEAQQKVKILLENNKTSSLKDYP